MDPDLQGEVLRVYPEGVEPDRLEHVAARQAVEASVNIRPGECVYVSHVKSLGGGIGKHHQVEEGGLGRAELGLGEAVRALGLPPFLPLPLHLGRDVALRVT